MKKIMLALSALLLHSAALNCNAESGPPAFAEIEVTGRGVSEDEAFKQAVVEAVRSVVGTLVTAENVVNNDQVIKDKVLTLSNGFVEKVLEQKKKKLEDGTYEVALKCVVRKGQLYGTLKQVNVPTMKFDGVSMFADVVSQVDFKKKAVENLTAAFGKFFAEFPSLYELATSKPEVVKSGAELTEMEMIVSGAVNYKRYYEEMAPALCAVLSTASGKPAQTLNIKPYHDGYRKLNIRNRRLERDEVAIQTGNKEWKIYEIDGEILDEVNPALEFGRGNKGGCELIGSEGGLGPNVYVIFLNSDNTPLCVSVGRGVLEVFDFAIVTVPSLRTHIKVTAHIPTSILPLITHTKLRLGLCFHRDGNNPYLPYWRDGLFMCSKDQWGNCSFGESVKPIVSEGDSHAKIFLGVNCDLTEPPVNEKSVGTSAPVQVKEVTPVTPTTAEGKEVPYGTPKPAVLVETKPPALATDHVWIDGIWAWRKTRAGFGRWEWVPGEWVVPPHRGAVWAKGGFVNKAWVDGHWR